MLLYIQPSKVKFMSFDFDTIKEAQRKDAEFGELTPAERKAKIDQIFKEADAVRRESYANSDRRGQTSGYAFLWVNVYGRGKLANAFRRRVKNSSSRVIKNYRGAKFAWYFGSQSDLGIYDSLKGMTKFLSDQGIECFVDDEWD